MTDKIPAGMEAGECECIQCTIRRVNVEFGTYDIGHETLLPERRGEPRQLEDESVRISPMLLLMLILLASVTPIAFLFAQSLQ